MFKEWDFLLAEIWGLLALAVLLGLIAGWLIFGGRRAAQPDVDEVARLKAELGRAKAQARSTAADPLNDIPPMQGGGYVRPANATQPTPAPKSTPAPAAAAPKTAPKTVPTPEPKPADPTPAPQVAATPRSKPLGLDAPRDGLPDDLTKIKGIGAKMEKLCNSLGFWHYDQIASWSADEIAWVDDNLEGFKGRVSRDQWVDQARALATNQTPAFVRRKP